MKYRYAMAGTIAAALIAGSSIGIAAGGTHDPNASPGTPIASPHGASSAASDAITSKPANKDTIPTNVIALAHTLGVTPQHLIDGLRAVKAASNGTPLNSAAAAATLAATLHVSQSAAQAALTSLLATPVAKPGAPAQPNPQMVSSLAASLQITTAQAQHVWDLLNAMDEQGQSRDPSQSPAIRAAATYLGLSTSQLITELTAWKMSFHPSAPTSTPAK
jgi:hypothetical protein